MVSNYNIGPRIGIEGEAEFRRQISRINSEYKSMDSYLKSVEKSMELQGRTQEGLALKSNALRQQIAKQEQAYEQYADALEKIKKLEGDHSEELLRYQGALLHTENTISELRRELDNTEGELKRMADGLDDVGDAAADADDKVPGFLDVFKANIASSSFLNVLEEAGDAIVEIGSHTIEAAADVKAANAQFSQTFGNLEGTATSALRSISEDTQIATTRLQRGYTALYAFTKSVGGDSDAALNIANRALRAGADSAAYYDRSLEDTLETLQSFIKGNYENDAALGIAATETTRNAKANELYAKSFNDLTEAQKVDVLLSMVEAGNAASGALGQAAREADSWANVQGEFNEALRQTMAWLGSPILSAITPIIQGATGALKELTAVSAWEQLNTGVAQFESGVRNAETALSESNSQIAATSGLAREYVSRLQELEETGLETADSQREYATTVELLNTLLPDLNLSIDKVTGRLNQNTDSILDNIDALQEQIRAQAEQEYYAEIIEAQVAAEKDLYDARLRQSELQAKIKVLQDQGVQSVDRFAAAQAAAAGTGTLFWQALSAEERELYELQQELALTNRAITDGETTVAGYAAQLNAAKDYSDQLGGSTKELGETTGGTTSALATLKDLYAAAEAEARESISSQIGLFEEMADASEMSAEEIVANWGKQREAFINYADNLKKAVDMGLDEALVTQLSDGSQQSMLILEELVNGTELSIDEINAAFRGVEEGKDYLDKAYADLALIASDEFARMVEYAKAAGVDTVDGLVEAIYANAYKAEAAARHMAVKTQYGFNHEMQINSPSRRMMQSADYTVDGLVLELQARERDAEAAMRSLARSGNEAYIQEQLDYVSQYPSMVAGAAGYGGTTTNNHSVAYGGISINISTQPGQDERAIANAVVAELTARFGREEAAF